MKIRLPQHGFLATCVFILAWVSLSSTVNAMPAFARQYEVSCALCHAAVPRLNEFGKSFIASNYRLPNWRDKAIDMGDEQLALPRVPPFAIRAQAFAQGREAESLNQEGSPLGPTGNNAKFDIQAPYLIKLLSSAPLSDHLTYYFYGIFAEKGGNGTTIIEDAWLMHDDVFGSGVNMQFGQFQISDLMYSRENRMTFMDFMAYRMAGITYDRGVIFSRDVGPLSVSVGAANGSGIEQNFAVNSAGFRRPDRLFDNDSGKTLYGRLGGDVGPVAVGLLGLSGKQKSADNVADPAGAAIGTRKTDKQVIGIDMSGTLAGEQVYWFGQVLWNEWSGFLDASPNKDYKWFGGFAGVDYIHSDRWAYSALYNYADANDFKGTGSLYEGIDINSLTLTAAYYFMRNVKGVIEANMDFLAKDNDANFVGHETKENYLLVGVDLAF